MVLEGTQKTRQEGRDIGPQAGAGIVPFLDDHHRAGQFAQAFPDPGKVPGFECHARKWLPVPRCTGKH